jgi:hypothetical protein
MIYNKAWPYKTAMAFIAKIKSVLASLPECLAGFLATI